MFCGKCGNEMPDGFDFCMKCGANLNEMKESKSIVLSKSNILIDDTMSIQNSDIEIEECSQLDTRKNFPLKLLLIILSIILIIVALMTFAWFKFIRIYQSKPQYDFMNINMGGYLTYDNDKIYYLSEDEDSDDTFKKSVLYSCNLNGMNKKLLTKTENISCLTVVGDKLFYKKYTKDGDDTIDHICSIDKDGSNETILKSYEKNQSISNLIYCNNYLYYEVGDTLYKNNNDFNKEEVVLEAEGLGDFCVCDSYIIYSNKDSINKYSTITKKHKEIVDNAGNDLSIYKDKLYYINSENSDGFGGSIYSYDFSSKENKKLCASDSMFYVIDDDRIYYSEIYSTDDLNNIANEYTDDDLTAALLELAMFGAGDFYSCDLDGKNEKEFRNSGEKYIGAYLYYSPETFYYQLGLTSGLERLND